MLIHITLLNVRQRKVIELTIDGQPSTLNIKL